MHPEDDLLEQSLQAWDVPAPPPNLTDRVLSRNADTLARLQTPPPDESPTMLPTEPAHSSNLRPFWSATFVGFAAAAALLLAFAAGRQADNPPVTPPATPSHVEVQVTAPPPAPPAPVEVRPTAPATPTSPKVAPKAPAPPTQPAPKTKPSKPAKPVATGLVRIGTNSGAPPASVRVDGEPRGSTPISRLDLPVGKHTVEFTWPDGTTDTQTFEVKAEGVVVVRGG